MNQTYVDTAGPTVLSLCAGVGMLDVAVRLVFPGARFAALCEWEGYAAGTLLARMEDQSLEPAPIWCGDLRYFDAREFRDLVDILIAGLPCQPYSLAGKQSGNADERSFGAGDGPIPGFLRIVDQCRPAVVWLENVPAWVRNRKQWFRPVGEALCRMGYTLVEPVFLTAKDVGAGHKRERVFILAYLADGEHRQRWAHWQPGQHAVRQATSPGGDGLAQPECAQRRAGFEHECLDHAGERPDSQPGDRPVPCECGHPGVCLADARDGRLQEPGRGAQERDGVGPAGAPLADTQRAGPQGPGPADSPRRSVTEPRYGDWGIFAPGPNAVEQWAEIIRDHPVLAPAIPKETPQSSFCRVANGLDNRPHDTIDCADETKHDSQTSAEGDPGAALPEVRENDQGPSSAPRGLQQSAECGNPVSSVPHPPPSGEGGHPEGGRRHLSGVRSAVSTKAQQARYALWFCQMQSDFRTLLGGEAMGEPEQVEILRRMWARISIQESTREDLLTFLRQTACMDFEEIVRLANQHRSDALRCAGNGVVPLQASVALVELLRRAQIINLDDVHH